MTAPTIEEYREVLKKAEYALDNCYDVQQFPADGTTTQDEALSDIRALLSRATKPAGEEAGRSPSDAKMLERLKLAFDDPMWADHAEVHKHFLRVVYDRLAALTSPALEAEPVTPGPYAARFCPGIPTSCCDYGVISVSLGREICRVWEREDAEHITSLLNAHPPTSQPAQAVDRNRKGVIEHLIHEHVRVQDGFGGAQFLVGADKAADAILSLLDGGQQ